MTLEWTRRSFRPKKKYTCRHYRIEAMPERGANWLRCLDCGREYQADRPSASVGKDRKR